MDSIDRNSQANDSYRLKLASNVFLFFAGLFWIIAVIIAIRADKLDHALTK